jgi:hypothetical protein
MAQDGAGELGEEALDEVEPGAVLGREGELEAAGGSSGEPSSGFPGDVRGMVVEDQLDRGAGRISGIDKLEEFDELSAAVAISNQSVDLPGEQINPGQQSEGAMAFVLMITRERRVDARLGWQIGRRRRDSLDSWLFVAGDNRHRLGPFIRLGGGLFQDLNLAIDAQHLCHLLLEVGIAAFQIVTHLVWLYFFFSENLAHRALDERGETSVPRRGAVFARVARQQPRRPQLVRITVIFGLVACQGYQPSLSLRRDRRLLARSRSVVEGRQGTIGQRPFDAALDRLVMPSLRANAKNDGFSR